MIRNLNADSQQIQYIRQMSDTIFAFFYAGDGTWTIAFTLTFMSEEPKYSEVLHEERPAALHTATRLRLNLAVIMAFIARS